MIHPQHHPGPSTGWRLASLTALADKVMTTAGHPSSRPFFMSIMLAIGLLLARAGSVWAGAPTHVAFPVNYTLASPSLTAACGFPITVSYRGTYTATLFRSAWGAVERELDTQPATVVTVGAPGFGTSFSFADAARFAYDYPVGVLPGSAAIVNVRGLGDKIPGIPADAGVVTFGHAIVLFTTADGVPIVDFGLPTAFVGSVNDPQAAAAAVCRALGPAST